MIIKTSMFLSLLFFIFSINAASSVFASAKSLLALHTRASTFELDDTGSLIGIYAVGDAQNYLATGQPAPLLSLRINGVFHAPVRAEWNGREKKITLQYAPARISAVIKVISKPTHIIFEVVDIHSTLPVELILWGPYPTTIKEIIGETVGVVRDDRFAIGIQALNARTLGGFPTNENDIEAECSDTDLGHYTNLDPELLKEQGYRGDTARRTSYGSVLQAFCRNREQEHIIPNWGHEQYLVKPFADGGVIGSKIALFACPANKALKTIGAIEIAENLPHPMLNGVWAKETMAATSAYLIVDFSEENISRAIEMTLRAGLKYLYHSSPFETWGHFKLKASLFPHGWDGMRTCVEKAKAAGIDIGFHTLSNFITPNDPYVTPKPDTRLARIGNSTLTGAIDASLKVIPIASPAYFTKLTAMNTIVIGDELIKYHSVSADVPYRLLDCERGAWGTKASSHSFGDMVGKLLDHEYGVFLSDANLSQEIARNIADLFNHTGTLQLSFDGLEGNWSNGYGQYGRTLFTKSWFDSLSAELRGHVINDASNPGHFNWHINTRMNWGEPWYAGFRESQTLYRFKNQVYFERNLMPHMLGWFALRPNTSLEDAEWLLARAAGYDAGFALATSLASTAQLAADPASAEAARIFGSTGEVLEAVRQWETARMSGAFPDSLKAELRDNHREFHLQPKSNKSWDISELHTARLTLNSDSGLSGELELKIPESKQSLYWTIHSDSKEPIGDITLEIDGVVMAQLKEQSLPPGGSLRYRGGTEAMISDTTGHEIGLIPCSEPTVAASSVLHKLKVTCGGSVHGSLKIECSALGLPRRITSRHALTPRPPLPKTGEGEN